MSKKKRSGVLGKWQLKAMVLNVRSTEYADACMHFRRNLNDDIQYKQSHIFALSLNEVLQPEKRCNDFKQS